MNKISTSMEDHKIICNNIVAPLNWPAYKQDKPCLKLVDFPAFHRKRKYLGHCDYRRGETKE